MAILKKELNINSQNYQQFLSILSVEGAQSRLIGGCVRDALLNKLGYDIDIATTLMPNQVIQILTAHNIKVVPTGIKFGTVSAFFKGERFEITTLRSDLNCNGRHADVTFTTDFKVDAARRDFTINALSYCPFKGEVYDYFNGLADLQASRVIFIGNPNERIREDDLRILRFFRFSSLYAKEIDQEGLAACIEFKNNLKILSKERIIGEMDKILSSSNIESVLTLMVEKGFLQILFPIFELDAKVFNRAIKFTVENNLEFELYTKYALMFFQTKELKIKYLVNLKFSRSEAHKIFNVILFLKEFNALNKDFLLKKVWLEEDDYLQYIIALISYSHLTQNQANEFIFKYAKFDKPAFMINGNDLLKLNIQGKKIGNSLEHIKKLWIESDFQLKKDQLIEKLHTINEH